MPFPLDRLLHAWNESWPDDAAARAAFAALYTDPVALNGILVTLDGLVAMARTMHEVYAEPRRQILDVVEAPGRVAFAFRLTARHVGPLATRVGTVDATGRTVALTAVDVLTLTDGRISAGWVVADELGLLAQLDAVRLAR